jgi:hypothetical protein
MRKPGYIFVALVILSLVASCGGANVHYFEFKHKQLDTSQSCTAFCASDGEVVLVGNNEDHSYPFTKVWFMPPEDGKYGGVYFVFDDLRGGARGGIQGGMNDQGLFFDSFSGLPVEVSPKEGKPVYLGNLILKAMAECATVEEVLELFDQHSLPGIWKNQIFVADSIGDSAIIEPLTVTRKTGHYQIVTNFYQSETRPEEITCWRYKTAKDMLESTDSISADLFRGILNATSVDAASGNAPTQYSNIYDLRQRIIYVYHFLNYENVLVIDVDEELKKGSHSYDLPSLFPRNDAWERWKQLVMEKFNKELEQMGLATHVDPDVYDAYVGQYNVPAELRFLSFPPAIIAFVNVTQDEDKLYVKASQEGSWWSGLELFPKSETSFFHTSLAGSPDFECTFIKDLTGQVTQATIKIQLNGLETATLKRDGVELALLIATAQVSPDTATKGDTVIISASVKDDSGKPVEGAKLTATTMLRANGPEVIVPLADQGNGNYQRPLNTSMIPEGTYTFTVFAEKVGYQTAETSAILTVSEAEAGDQPWMLYGGVAAIAIVLATIVLYRVRTLATRKSSIEKSS